MQKRESVISWSKARSSKQVNEAFGGTQRWTGSILRKVGLFLSYNLVNRDQINCFWRKMWKQIDGSVILYG